MAWFGGNWWNANWWANNWWAGGGQGGGGGADPRWLDWMISKGFTRQEAVMFSKDEQEALTVTLLEAED